MERTSILPLRWLANFLEIPAHYLMSRWMDKDTDRETWGLKIATFLYINVITRWGTYYVREKHDCSGF